jgi:RNase P/RNase MRP subunit POP5
MKALRPSMKENKRYLIVQGKDLKENIEKSILEFSGTFGLAKCGLSFISSDSSKDMAIISINRESVDLVRASFVVFPEKMEVTKVSGTLKGLGKK